MLLTGRTASERLVGAWVSATAVTNFVLVATRFRERLEIVAGLMANNVMDGVDESCSTKISWFLSRVRVSQPDRGG